MLEKCGAVDDDVLLNQRAPSRFERESRFLLVQELFYRLELVGLMGVQLLTFLVLPQA